eukprot:27987-Eustigmatos_ZCMA.PRE.1
MLTHRASGPTGISHIVRAWSARAEVRGTPDTQEKRAMHAREGVDQHDQPLDPVEPLQPDGGRSQ